MKKILFLLLRLSGLPIIFREVIQRNRVTIIYFHDIDLSVAEKSFKYLSQKYNIISLNDFINFYENKGTIKIPKKALIITFDDGHIGNYEIFPLIKKYQLPVTIFLCAGIINTNHHFWFKFVDQLESKFLEGKQLDVQELKNKSNSERLKILSEFGFKQDKKFEIPQALKKEHIDEMKFYINMQSHTLFHPILPMCDFNEARTEILGSKEILENEYNFKINALSYPNGDYSEREILLTKEAGYRCGVTTDFGYNTVNTDLFRLRRISVNDTEDLNELIVKSSGLWGFLKTKIFVSNKSI